MKILDSKIFRLFSWALVFAYMGLIFYMSSVPNVDAPSPFPNFDKVIHFHVYLLLAFLVTNALPHAHSKKRFLWAFLITALYGVSDEIHQYFNPPRDCSFYDWLADICGAWIGAWIFLKSENIWRKR